MTFLRMWVRVLGVLAATAAALGAFGGVCFLALTMPYVGVPAYVLTVTAVIAVILTWDWPDADVDRD